MQEHVQIQENSFIQDLGTGFSYINFDRYIKDVDGEGVVYATEQYKVQNPATYETIVDQVVQVKFCDGRSQAAIRKGIINAQDVDFIEFNSFVEAIKQKCKDEGVQ
jgi:hypothetical protein